MLQQEKNLDKMLLPWHLSKHQAKAPTVCTTVTMSPWQREGYVPLYPVRFWNGISHLLQEHCNPVQRALTFLLEISIRPKD